jgi:hypothetical protein
MIVTLLPICFLVACAMGLFIPLFFLDRCDRHNDDDTKRKQRVEWRKKYWKLVLYMIIPFFTILRVYTRTTCLSNDIGIVYIVLCLSERIQQNFGILCLSRS